MTRRRNKPRQRRTTYRKGIRPEGLPVDRYATTQAALAAGRHRDAIAGFKELLKTGRRPEWLEGLSQAYAGRAADLAGKRMFKEAAAIWEQRAAACDLPLPDSRYLLWLLHGGRYGQAAGLYRENLETLARGGEAALAREHLAAFALAGGEGLLDALDPDDPVARDHGAATAALVAYCGGDAPGLEAQLRRIPFRSPYRYFRQFLKSLGLVGGDPEGATRLLERIAPDSPFAGGPARAVEVAALPLPQCVSRWQELDDEGRQLVTTLKGWSTAQVKFLQDASSILPGAAAKQLLALLTRHRGLMGQDWIREAAANLLIGHPQGWRQFNRSFGQLPRLTALRLSALEEEKEGDPFAIEAAWAEVLDELERRPDSEDRRLRMALVLRRISDFRLKGEAARHIHPEALAELERSLELDPDDLPTYLRLITLHREGGRLRQARRFVAAALERFTDDSEVLLAAVETAIAGNAFKKATGYAKRLLTLDPINPKVKGILLKASLGHGYKHIRAGRSDLAHKALDEATGWAGSEAARGRINLVRGLLARRAGDGGATALLQQGVEQAGGGLTGRLCLLLEAARLGERPHAILKAAGLQQLRGFDTREQILALVEYLHTLAEEDAKWLDAAMTPLHGPIRKAAGAAYSEGETERVCELWLRRERSGLLKLYAGAALKRWPERPALVYYLEYARCEETILLSPGARQRLAEALEQAQKEGDQRTTHRIVELLGPAMGVPPIDPFPYDGDDMAEDLAGAMGELGPEHFLDILEEIGGAEFREIRKQLGDEKAAEFMEIMASGGDVMEALVKVVGGLGAPKPGGRRGKSRGSAGKGRSGKADPAVDEWDPDQLELF